MATLASASAPSAVLAPPYRERDAAASLCWRDATLPCDVRDEHCQSNLFELMQCLAGTRAPVRPPLRFVSESDARAAAQQQREQAERRRAPLQYALERLGLASPARPRAAAGGAIGANAYYAPRERAVMFVVKEAVPTDGALAAFILGHEYVHAIQDRGGALGRLLQQRDEQTFEQALSQWSLLEGEATLLEEIVRSSFHGREPSAAALRRFAIASADSDDAIVRQARPLEAAFATFPYTYGAYWAAAHWSRQRAPLSTGVEGSLRLSSRDLLAERHAWPSGVELHCADDGAEQLGSGYQRRARDVLGAWLMQAYVRRETHDRERALAAARDSRGDWIATYARGASAEYGFVWRTCWDAASTALAMRQLIEDQLRETPGPAASVTSVGNWVTATVPPA